MNNHFKNKLTTLRLIRYATPTIIMMMFMSLYTIVDGIFVSRLVGTDALSAINIVYPLFIVVLALGLMLSSGGSAIVGKRLGEGKRDLANKNFTQIAITSVVIGIVISLLGLIFIDPILNFLGATSNLYDYGKTYLTILLIFTSATMLQMLFNTFFITAGKPTLGMIITIIAGITNIVFDYLFIAVMDLGIAGAAYATSLGFLVTALSGLLFFSFNRNGLCFTKPSFDFQILIKTCSNGISEMLTQLSSSIITLLFNLVMLKLVGEDGVAAITIILYAEFLLIAIYLGYTMGVGPLISYNYGSKDEEQLTTIYKSSLKILSIVSIVVLIASITYAPFITELFTPSSSNVYELTVNGFILYSTAFLFKGFNIYASGKFTALSNGLISGIISFIRTLILPIIGFMILPRYFGINGVWLIIPIAEFITLFISFYYLRKYKNTYGYNKTYIK